MNSNELERDAIEAAMARLLAGTPIRSSGTLTIMTLAIEAGLKRNKLTHKHTDLRDRFRAEVVRLNGVTEREARLLDELELARHQLAEAKADRDNYRATSEVFARAMHVLTVENEALRKEVAKINASRVVPIRR
jgi:hypothetical protein